MTPAHDFIVIGEGLYRVEVPDIGVVLQVDRLRRKSGELIGELTVTCNLRRRRARDRRGHHQRRRPQPLQSCVPGKIGRPGWRSAADLTTHSTGPARWSTSCLRVIGAERMGQPAVLLRDVPKPSPDQTWLVHGLPILREQPMILFGDGGSGKSLLALAVAGELSQRGVSALYADWETSCEDHRDRLEQIFGPDTMPAVRYVRGRVAPRT